MAARIDDPTVAENLTGVIAVVWFGDGYSVTVTIHDRDGAPLAGSGNPAVAAVAAWEVRRDIRTRSDLYGAAFDELEHERRKRLRDTRP